MKEITVKGITMKLITEWITAKGTIAKGIIELGGTTRPSGLRIAAGCCKESRGPVLVPPGLAHHSRDAKIAQHRFALGAEEHIARGNITVCNTLSLLVT